MGTSGRTSHKNYARKRGKYTSSKRKKVQERASLQKFSIGLNNTTNTIKQSIRWQRVRWDPVKLYPNIIFDKNDNPDRRPTPEEVALACKIVNDKFFLLKKGRSVVRDPLNKNSIIAVIEFTPWDKLSNKDKKDLEFMWAIGWQKSQDFLQIVGRYIKQFNASQKTKYDIHFSQSSRAGKIIGKYFKELSSVAFNNNWATMKKFNIPSFDHLSYGEKPSPTTCSPHITFTTDNFFNPPHIDKGDLSDYAFVMFLPTYSATGKLAPPDSNYNVSGGPFVFPDHQFGIKFDHQHGIVKMIWKANEYRHCTLPSSSSSTFTRLGFSLQINYSLARTCDKEQKGYYNNPLQYFACSLNLSKKNKQKEIYSNSKLEDSSVTAIS
ncbi:hypothetical protein Pst134EB_008906 [Puccinia striiformis f. sp. tritici]|nr:hypothetical protein Pst134EB_008906 [Puccinia striiformis f. sp. tritici]